MAEYAAATEIPLDIKNNKDFTNILKNTQTASQNKVKNAAKKRDKEQELAEQDTQNKAEELSTNASLEQQQTIDDSKNQIFQEKEKGIKETKKKLSNFNENASQQQQDTLQKINTKVKTEQQKANKTIEEGKKNAKQKHEEAKKKKKGAAKKKDKGDLEGAADVMTTGTAASALTRTYDKKRSGSSDAPALTRDERRQAELREAAIAYAKKAIPALAGMLIGGYFLFQWAFSTPLPDLEYVTGVVTRNNAPLAGVIVRFAPIPPEGGLRLENATSSEGTTDENGEYVLMYDPENAGVLPGDHQEGFARPMDRGDE